MNPEVSLLKASFQRMHKLVLLIPEFFFQRFSLEKSSKNQYIYYFIFFSLIVSFYTHILKILNGPLFGFFDIETWEHLGFYFQENLRFSPFPNLILNSNLTVFTFGASHAFLDWCLEREYFFSCFYKLFGIGPWLKIYYFASILLIFFGSYHFLKKEYSREKSFFIATLLSFCNFYGILKYPLHLSIAAYHWLVLGVLLDFLIYRELLYSKKLNLEKILYRIIFLFLGFGLNLGYVQGYNITSFLVFSFFSGIYFLLHFSKISFDSISLKKVFLFVGIYLIIVILYFPILFQILSESHKLKDVQDFYWWNHPLRIFLPFFGSFNPSKFSLEVFFQDKPEGFAGSSVGIGILGLGVFSLFTDKKHFYSTIPLWIMILLYLSFHPIEFPFLKKLPWFQFHRVSGRATIFLSIAFALMSLGWKSNNTSLLSKWSILVFAIFTTMETRNVYLASPNAEFSFSQQFQNYFQTVKNAKGEAVLDWPFCIAGANSHLELCKDNIRINTAHALQRFHEKKVVGQYFGKILEEHVSPFRKEGWEALFLQDSVSGCMPEQGLEKFGSIYQKYDFSGIQLYLDLMPSECSKKFMDRFGNPIAEVYHPQAGRMVFLPKK